MPPVTISPEFLGFAARGADWADWLTRLPRIVRDLLAEWELRPAGDPAYGECAIVVPVRTVDGADAVLKVGFPHWEAEHEHLALRIWDGDGAVRLLRADPHRHALLLERARQRDLTSVDEIEACQVVAATYRRLHKPAGPRFRKLSDLVAGWSAELLALPMSAPVPRRYVEQAAALAGDFGNDPHCDGRLVHTDLHFVNVLAAEREPWLVIDPKPLSGDPHYEVAPLLWNRWEEAAAGGRLREALRQRFYAVVDTAELDDDRARDWVIVRVLLNVLWTLERPDAPPGELPRHHWLTRNIAIAKAIQD